MRAESRRNHVARKLRGRQQPARKHRLQPRACQLRHTIRANVFQKQVAKRDALNTFAHRPRTSITHQRFVNLIRAGPRQRHFPHRQPRRFALRIKERLAITMHCHARKLLVDRRQQSNNFERRIAPQQMQRPGAVLAARPAQQNPFACQEVTFGAVPEGGRIPFNRR